MDQQIEQPSDISYQVMPQEGHFEPVPASAPAVPPALPAESGPSFWRSRLLYIIAGAVVLVVLGVLAFFMFRSKQPAPVTVPAVVVTKLPKVWLQQYFSSETCTDQTMCGDEADSDKDGLTNHQEFKAGTSPVNVDTDADLIADGDEVNIYKTEPTLKYTDRRDIVQQNDWTDGVQIKGGYDPLTPGLKFTDVRKQQIADDTAKFSLHEPTKTSLAPAVSSAPAPAPAPVPQPTPGPQSSLPDLIISSVTVSPNHPVVNDKNVLVTATIKNIGNKSTSSNEALDVEFSIVGFDQYPTADRTSDILNPGESRSFKYYPYKDNDFFKVTDTAGTKTLKIVIAGGNSEINKTNHDVVESNYNNNTFTQQVEMFSN